MIIHKITPYVDYNKWLKRFDTQFNEPANQNFSKYVKPNKKKSLETSIINIPMSPPLSDIQW